MQLQAKASFTGALPALQRPLLLANMPSNSDPAGEPPVLQRPLLLASKRAYRHPHETDNQR